VESALGLEMPEEITNASVELAAFCRGEYPKLAGMLALYCGDRDLAQDLAQETMVRVVQNWKKVSRLPAPSMWCRKVAINSANSWFRRAAAKRRATRRLEGRARLPHDYPDSASAVAVRTAVANLPARQKTVVVLRFFADLPVDEVARLMRCEQGTVWSLTNQAIASLRSAGLVELKEAADVE
jgi:RNA polymerase sigma factor (sigma-70 family)